MKQKTKKPSFTPFYIVIVVVIVLILTSYLYQMNLRYQAFKPSVNSNRQVIGQNTPTEKITPTSYDPYNKTYVSKNLGIKFNYSSHECLPNEKVTIGIIHEVGNTIYYTQNQNDAITSGHKIQVLNKNPKISLVDAINNNLLNNYKRSDCYAIPSSVSPKAPEGWSEAEVSFPDNKNPMDVTNLPNCSQDYEKFNEARSFWMSPEEPSKYLFLEMGQSTLGCGGADIDLQSITFLK